MWLKTGGGAVYCSASLTHMWLARNTLVHFGFKHNRFGYNGLFTMFSLGGPLKDEE